jgi:hypothetical protein
MGAALTPHGELLRCVRRIYYDCYNNGFGNGPFEHEWSVIESHRDGLIKHVDPKDFDDFARAFRRKGLGEFILDHGSANWEGAAPMEKVVAAAVQHVAAEYAHWKAQDRPQYTSVRELTQKIQREEASEREEAIQYLVQLTQCVADDSPDAVGAAAAKLARAVPGRSPRP